MTAGPAVEVSSAGPDSGVSRAVAAALTAAGAAEATAVALGAEAAPDLKSMAVVPAARGFAPEPDPSPAPRSATSIDESARELAARLGETDERPLEQVRRIIRARGLDFAWVRILCPDETPCGSAEIRKRGVTEEAPSGYREV